MLRGLDRMYVCVCVCVCMCICVCVYGWVFVCGFKYNSYPVAGLSGTIKSISQFLIMVCCPFSDSIKPFLKTPRKRQTAESNN